MLTAEQLELRRTGITATEVAAMAANTELTIPPENVVMESYRLYQPGVRRRFGILEWPALLKKLDRIDPSYRD